MTHATRYTLWGLAMTILIGNSPAPAADPTTPAEALQLVRQAVGFDALRKQSAELLLEGSVEHLGMGGDFRVLISPSGEFLQSIEAHGTHELGFDGKAAWERSFS